ncbi:MAG TPA: hypothetical protein VNU01_02165 [Egibacteraceae bacterium]|nr:hypothetical protein [Egibacteraceae bacterium]
MDCPDCDFVAKNGNGLARHRQAKHKEQRAEPGPNERAIAITLRALGEAGRLEAVDEARVTALRTMAVALDLNPFNSQMFREYREALEGLMVDDSDSGGLEELIAAMRSPVRDT